MWMLVKYPSLIEGDFVLLKFKANKRENITIRNKIRIIL